MSVVKNTDAVLIDTPLTRYDLTLDDDGDILTDDFFDTSLIVSLFVNRRASESEVLLPEQRSGWIGNEFTPGFEIGSKLWIFEQARLTLETINDMVSVVEEGLQWLIDDDLAVSVAASVSPSNGKAVLTVIITRTNSKVEKRLFELWDNSGVTVRT